MIESVADANIGSILGIGFPGWTGGVLQYINGYEGGLPGFVARARELADPTATASRRPSRWWRRPRAGASTPTRCSPRHKPLQLKRQGAL